MPLTKVNQNAIPLVLIVNADGEAVDVDSPNADALNAANPVALLLRALGYVFNGTTWDRARGDTANGLDVDVTRLPALVAGSANIGNVDVATDPVFGTIATGELAGSASAVQMPAQACRLVKFKAAYDNTGRVYLGGSGVTKKDGTTDVTTGLELSAGEETGWLPVSNLNVLYRISDNAGDDLTYIAMVS